MPGMADAWIGSGSVMPADLRPAVISGVHLQRLQAQAQAQIPVPVQVPAEAQVRRTIRGGSNGT